MMRKVLRHWRNLPRAKLHKLAKVFWETAVSLFYFIGNSEFWKHKKEQVLTEQDRKSVV